MKNALVPDYTACAHVVNSLFIKPSRTVVVDLTFCSSRNLENLSVLIRASRDRGMLQFTSVGVSNLRYKMCNLHA